MFRCVARAENCCAWLSRGCRRRWPPLSAGSYGDTAGHKPGFSLARRQSCPGSRPMSGICAPISGALAVGSLRGTAPIRICLSPHGPRPRGQATVSRSAGTLAFTVPPGTSDSGQSSRTFHHQAPGPPPTAAAGCPRKPRADPLSGGRRGLARRPRLAS